MADTPEQLTPVALHPVAHKGKRIKQIGSPAHLASNHFAKVYTQEYAKAGVEYPIIFVQDPQSEEFISAVLWGVTPRENLFVKDGRWVGGYLPASVRCFPFTMSPDPDNEGRLYIGIFDQTEFVTDDEGELIFNDDGTETEWFSKTKEFLINVFQQEQSTKAFAKILRDADLLVPQTIAITDQESGKKQEISGFYVVDREKFKALSDEKIIEFHKNNVLELIYDHLISLESLDKLVRQKGARGKADVTPGTEQPAS